MSSELQPSKLGTKQYWENVYEKELSNFEELGDEGEVWFGIETVEKMVDWTRSSVPHFSRPSIIEIGSGNGTLLFALAEAGYPPSKLTGIDYSADAVNLAKAISIKRDIKGITFVENDFLKDDLHGTWDLVLDKGTYDAMALGPKDEHGYSPAILYPTRLAKLLKPGSYFLITCACVLRNSTVLPSSEACNFTADELKSIFVTAETGLEYQWVKSYFIKQQLTRSLIALGFNTQYTRFAAEAEVYVLV